MKKSLFVTSSLILFATILSAQSSTILITNSTFNPDRKWTIGGSYQYLSHEYILKGFTSINPNELDDLVFVPNNGPITYATQYHGLSIHASYKPHKNFRINSQVSRPIIRVTHSSFPDTLSTRTRQSSTPLLFTTGVSVLLLKDRIQLTNSVFYVTNYYSDTVIWHSSISGFIPIYKSLNGIIELYSDKNLLGLTSVVGIQYNFARISVSAKLPIYTFPFKGYILNIPYNNSIHLQGAYHF